jgi:hypothetical protein
MLENDFEPEKQVHSGLSPYTECPERETCKEPCPSLLKLLPREAGLKELLIADYLA